MFYELLKNWVRSKKKKIVYTSIRRTCLAKCRIPDSSYASCKDVSCSLPVPFYLFTGSSHVSNRFWMQHAFDTCAYSCYFILNERQCTSLHFLNAAIQPPFSSRRTLERFDFGLNYRFALTTVCSISYIDKTHRTIQFEVDHFLKTFTRKSIAFGLFSSNDETIRTR